MRLPAHKNSATADVRDRPCWEISTGHLPAAARQRLRVLSGADEPVAQTGALAEFFCLDAGEGLGCKRALVDLCLAEKARQRKVLAYTVYSGTRDTTSRLKRMLEQAGLKVAVLRASVDTARREDWIFDQVDRGIDVRITNPERVKTGLDLLDFPTIAFLQTGYNVYTPQQAARRSWRIGQKHPVRVVFLGYAGSSQITCLQLMAKKIAVAQSASGDVPESGLDALNQDGDSVEMALARQLIAA